MSKGGGGFRLGTPLNQLRHSNIAVVRYKFGGQRFEIACYKNKVVSYRQGIEKDLGEVLQVERVFTNVGKGEYATSRDLVNVFGHDNEAEICVLILQKGELQVNARERQAELDTLFRDVVTIVTEKSINSENNRRYPLATIDKALRQIGFPVKAGKPTKAQALAAIKALQDESTLKIKRAPMKLKITAKPPVAAIQEYARSAAAEGAATILNDSVDPERGAVIELLLEPHLFREIEGMTKESGAGLTILDEAFAEDAEVAISDQVARLSVAALASHDGSSEDEDEEEQTGKKGNKAARKKDKAAAKRATRKQISSSEGQPDKDDEVTTTPTKAGPDDAEESLEKEEKDVLPPWVKKPVSAPKPAQQTRKEKLKKQRQQEKEEALQDLLQERMKKAERRKKADLSD